MNHKSWITSVDSTNNVEIKRRKSKMEKRRIRKRFEALRDLDELEDSNDCSDNEHKGRIILYNRPCHG